MKSKEFNKLSKRQLRYGFFSCTENSKKHFETALMCAEKKYFGIANSHLILAAEESIKAGYFVVKYLAPDKDISVDKIFYDHKIKHRLAIHVFKSANAITKKLYVDFLKDLAKEPKMKSEGIKNKLSEIEKHHKKISLLKYKKWWKEANTKKNLGFYVGRKRNKWQNPSHTISEKDYKKTLAIVSQITTANELLKLKF